VAGPADILNTSGTRGPDRCLLLARFISIEARLVYAKANRVNARDRGAQPRNGRANPSKYDSQPQDASSHSGKAEAAPMTPPLSAVAGIRPRRYGLTG